MSTSPAATWDERQLRNVVCGPVVAAHAPATIASLAGLMATHRIHGLLLHDSGQARWVTDLDVLRASVAGVADGDSLDRSAVPAVTPETSLRAAARALAQADATHALIRQDGNVTGVVSALDICAAIAGAVVGEDTRPASAGSAPEERRLDRVRAESVMHRGIISADPVTPLAILARMMSRTPIHGVVVPGLRRDRGGERLVWGVVTDLDIVHAAADGLDDVVAADLAGTEPLCADATDCLDDVARRLCEHAVTHVIVTDAGARPCGVVSTLDVLGAIARTTGV